jgi:6-pyruvoyltetrahydropterin/6-carboxytetrahydropterin synthase
MKQTIRKTYTNLKAAHRQWRHAGHCHFAHGENWTLHITMACEKLDEQNFVIDYGALRPLRAEIEQLFDHTLLIDHDDPARAQFEALHEQGLCDLRIVESASAEGLCKIVMGMADKCVRGLTGGRAWVEEVTVEEDTKNTATLRL